MRWLLIVLLFATTAVAQTIDVTGNLVNNTQTANTVTSTWQNAKFVNELTCWQGGDPNCSAGQPYLRPDGSINFSYGYTELYQIVNVSKALPNSGTGLVTTGFIFSWRSKNGNGWDDGRLDQLTAYVQGYTKSGKWIENFGYNLNFQHDWTDFTWSQDWSKLRRSDELANVLFGFSGKDNNYWMGPYGPEITNVNFRLRYKPDPCVNNPLYSPDCPKFQETLEKINESYTVDNATIKPTTVEYTASTTSATKPIKSSDTWHDEEYEDRQTSYIEYENQKLIDTLFKIEENQQREQNIAIDAATTAISETDKITQQTIRQAEQTASRSTKQSAEGSGIVQQMLVDNKQKDSKQEQSLALFQSNTISVQSLFQPNFSQQLNLLQPPVAIETQQAVQQNTNQQIKSDANQHANSLGQQAIIVQQNTNLVTTTTQQSQQNTSTNTTNIQLSLVNPLVSQTIEVPQQTQNFLTNKADPINSLLEAKQLEQENKSEQSTQQVKANTSDNDLANGVSLTQLAIAPANYNQYLNFVIRDVAFYPPREVYRNQRTVDNVRALRQLSSDRLHKQMVDQQYGGNRE